MSASREAIFSRIRGALTPLPKRAEYPTFADTTATMPALKRDGDPNLVLNQLYQYSRLEKTASIILLALVDGRPRTTKHDVVMHGLRDRLKGERAAPRQALLAEAGLAWMGRQLAEAGADLVADSLRVDGYQQHRISDGRGREIALSSLDFDGALLVTDPDRLLSRLASGFGSGRAYGFGLMLIRRA